MKRFQWRVQKDHTQATELFPFAIVNSRGEAVVLAKTLDDAKFIAGSAKRISQLESDATSYRWRYLGQLAARR